jgi:hypothetical protein
VMRNARAQLNGLASRNLDRAIKAGECHEFSWHTGRKDLLNSRDSIAISTMSTRLRARQLINYIRGHPQIVVIRSGEKHGKPGNTSL